MHPSFLSRDNLRTPHNDMARPSSRLPSHTPDSQNLEGCRGTAHVNDIQSQLNATRVAGVVQTASIEAIQAALRWARLQEKPVSVAGGRHAMGGQQFGSGTILLDLTGLNRVIRLDREQGRIEVEAGIMWPQLLAYLETAQAGDPNPWGFRQKQTWVDDVTLGGTLAANAHGRGLKFPPFISEVESFVLVSADGEVLTCSRRQNAELFSLAIGGYGLFGVVARITLKLVPRIKVRRWVEVIPVKDFLPRVHERIAEGSLYGDCQYATDLSTGAAEHPGVFAHYQPAEGQAPMPLPGEQRHLSQADWTRLYCLARTDKTKAFEVYSDYYLSTSGHVYWSDACQMNGSLDFYHEGIRQIATRDHGTEMITEVYVPRDELAPFLAAVRDDFLLHHADPTYGTIRLIERDAESFLAWAREPFACIVCNLHVPHTPPGIAKAKADFRRIIDRAIEFGGSFFLTYHRWATRRQVELCYPRFKEFLRLKRKSDPQERIQSNWYRHYKALFAV